MTKEQEDNLLDDTKHMSSPNLCNVCGQWPQNCTCQEPSPLEKLREARERLEEYENSDRRKTWEINILTKENREQARKLEEAKALEIYLKRDQDILREQRDEAAMSTHRQAMCINDCAAHIGPETSATIDGLPLAVKHLAEENRRLKKALRKAGDCFRRIEDTRWGYDGDCGTVGIANDGSDVCEEALAGRAAAEGSADENGEAKSGAGSASD